MYPLLTIDDINQRRREREVAAAQMRLARALRRQSTGSWGTGAVGRLRRRATAVPCPVVER